MEPVEDERTMTQIGKLGSVSFGSWWCGAGNDPQAPYEGREPTMRKGSYSEELVKIVVDAGQGGFDLMKAPTDGPDPESIST